MAAIRSDIKADSKSESVSCDTHLKGVPKPESSAGLCL